MPFQGPTRALFSDQNKILGDLGRTVVWAPSPSDQAKKVFSNSKRGLYWMSLFSAHTGTILTRTKRSTLSSDRVRHWLPPLDFEASRLDKGL